MVQRSLNQNIPPRPTHASSYLILLCAHSFQHLVQLSVDILISAAPPACQRARDRPLQSARALTGTCAFNLFTALRYALQPRFCACMAAGVRTPVTRCPNVAIHGHAFDARTWTTINSEVVLVSSHYCASHSSCHSATAVGARVIIATDVFSANVDWCGRSARAAERAHLVAALQEHSARLGSSVGGGCETQLNILSAPCTCACTWQSPACS